MRTAIRLAAVCLVLFPSALVAQSTRDKVTIRAVRVGFPPGPVGPTTGDPDADLIPDQRSPLYKPGAWTPVYIDVINNGKYDPKRDGPAQVVVEVFDCDDTANNYAVRLPDLEPGDSASVLAYTRAGSLYSDIVVHVQNAAGRALCQAHKTSPPALDPRQVLYLALGSRLPGLALPGQQTRDINQPPNPNNMAGNRAEAAVLTRVPELPPNWFGYSGADVVILATSDRDFMKALIGDTVRTGALAEWVRRGGRLVVLAGRGRDLLEGSADLKALLPMYISPKTYGVPEFQPIWKGVTAPEPLRGELEKGTRLPIEFSKFQPREKPTRGYRVLVDGPKVPEAEGSPFVVQGAYGLGRVTMVALDLDQKPFSNWVPAGRQEFWRQLLDKAGPRLPTNAGPQYPGGFRPPRGMYTGEADSDQQLTEMYNGLESFEGVPVISFGWVALFILLYILVVGPLDYLFLKKVVKRLELTWITFPTVVLAVSAAAYFTAYYLKGSELRINKFDLVDIDLQTGRAYGRSWFSVFSPRIQKYTVGVEPAGNWAAPAEGGPDTTLSWFGVYKQGRQSLFRHSYDYAPLARGLVGVPIQVWTTKSFQASWQAPLSKDKPGVESRLFHPPGRPDDLNGSVTSRLPAPLEEAVLIYRGEVATLGTLLPDTPKNVTAQNRVQFSQWLGSAGGLRGLLFHDQVQGAADPNNASLRDLDQSWRLNGDNRDEVILVGRLRQEQGQAEALTAGPASPSRLWLGDLPLSGQPRPTLVGRLRQDTLVRVFIPITPEPKPGE